MAEPARLSRQPDLELGFQEASREEVLSQWAEDVEAAGVNLLRGPQYDVLEIGGEAGEFVVRTRGGESFTTESVLIAIGMQGNLRSFGVEGDDLPHVTYQLDDPGAFGDKRIVVVGAGDAGIENALALVEHDNEVAVVNRRDEFDRAKARNRMLI